MDVPADSVWRWNRYDHGSQILVFGMGIFAGAGLRSFFLVFDRKWAAGKTENGQKWREHSSEQTIGKDLSGGVFIAVIDLSCWKRRIGSQRKDVAEIGRAVGRKEGLAWKKKRMICSPLGS